jgi:hypothetical protein
MSPASALRLVKAAHTLIWAFFAGCILAVPVAAWARRFDWAVLLAAVVFVEVFIIVTNRWRCPLTDVAARHTADRADNFDIYLPLWLARHNKTVFGTLYVVGLLVTLARWTGSR